MVLRSPLRLALSRSNHRQASKGADVRWQVWETDCILGNISGGDGAEKRPGINKNKCDLTGRS